MTFDTKPIPGLSIFEMIVDEFLRLGIRPDWHAGSATLRPKDFETEKKKPKPPRTFIGDNTGEWQLAVTPIRQGLKVRK